MPTERPIIFNGEMVRAILDGRKTQTRRVIKPQPTGRIVSFDSTDGKWYSRGDGQNIDWFYRCPYGQPGDLLVPRTTWATELAYDRLKPLEVPESAKFWSYWDSDEKPAWAGKQRPGRFLPKRLWHYLPRLENVGVRAQRLQDISVEDVKAEGGRRLVGGHSLSGY